MPRGGARPGAGRKRRPDDGRTLRIIKVALNDKEYKEVLRQSTDERRERLLKEEQRDESHA